MERAQARAYIGHIASLSRACVNQLFESSSASHTLLDNDIQRYLREINVLHQHAAIQPTAETRPTGVCWPGSIPTTKLSEAPCLVELGTACVAILFTARLCLHELGELLS